MDMTLISAPRRRRGALQVALGAALQVALGAALIGCQNPKRPPADAGAGASNTPSTPDARSPAASPQAAQGAAVGSPPAAKPVAEPAAEPAAAPTAEPAAGEAAGQAPRGGAVDLAGLLPKDGPVKRLTFDPKEVPEPLRGELEFGVRWDDFVGPNLVVATRAERKGASPDSKSALLTVTHWRKDMNRGDGSWQRLRDYKEFVEDCEFDLTLWGRVADWSLSDLDSDGWGELTMAWRSGCRSDLSPQTHKVLIIEDDKKYVLRGQSRLREGDQILGGEFKADAAFKGAPPKLLQHAQAVWEATCEDMIE